MQSRTLLAVALLVVAVVCSRTQPQVRNTVGRIKFKQYKSFFPLRRRSLIETDSDRSKIVQNIKKAIQKISQQYENHEPLSEVSATPVCTGSAYFCGRSTGSSGRALSDVYHPHGNSDNDHHREDEYFESVEELFADQLRLLETIKPAKIHSTLAPIRFTMTLSDPRTTKTLKHYRRDSPNRQETLKPTRKPVTMEPKYMLKSSGRHMSTKNRRSSSRYIFDATVMDLRNPNSPFEPESDQQLSVRVNPVKNPNDPFLIEIESDRKARINYNVKNGREPWDQILSDKAYKTKSHRSPFETNSDKSKDNKWKEPKKGKKNVKHF
jgi:hypothetical protein